jgi:hypothetical protein
MVNLSGSDKSGGMRKRDFSIRRFRRLRRLKEIERGSCKIGLVRATTNYQETGNCLLAEKQSA